ncbi:uncharacterized protein L969DRAFT_535470 [Mixia osmundae IAM 14324]|uniref:Uncharacterized protein n=1 Tax=Mixia osmundae (strain CBS 9802 / IAM 14324 / JCM 22182 / KY 12970) TaxID=764103 RepID=G7E7Q3_MIXOS|nr:uncharacterized protein L969DRAFT_535470 [Mixia osmundae IAM 14324]KEI38463.1 hypothetical protein L969DRAFT_535470 [Mixia osmundae IAM 14324]GAA98863.1 hypothetical protein E5Q_05551 [Mixia osmundae IAM 14324]
MYKKATLARLSCTPTRLCHIDEDDHCRRSGRQPDSRLAVSCPKYDAPMPLPSPARSANSPVQGAAPSLRPCCPSSIDEDDRCLGIDLPSDHWLDASSRYDILPSQQVGHLSRLIDEDDDCHAQACDLRTG